MDTTNAPVPPGNQKFLFSIFLNNFLFKNEKFHNVSFWIVLEILGLEYKKLEKNPVI